MQQESCHPLPTPPPQAGEGAHRVCVSPPLIPAQAGIQSLESGSPLEFTPAKAGAGTNGEEQSCRNHMDAN